MSFHTLTSAIATRARSGSASQLVGGPPSARTIPPTTPASASSSHVHRSATATHDTTYALKTDARTNAKTVPARSSATASASPSASDSVDHDRAVRRRATEERRGASPLRTSPP